MVVLFLEVVYSVSRNEVDIICCLL